MNINGTTESGCKVADTNYETDYNSMKAATNQNTAGIHDIDKEYWIASRFEDSSTSLAGFRMRYVETGGYVISGQNSNRILYLYPNDSSKGKSFSYGLRPVIILASDIQTSSGDGSEANAFKLVAKQ